MTDQPESTEATVEVSKAKHRIYIRFEGFLSLEDAKDLYEAYRRGIAEVGRGYTVLTYFRDFKPGTDEIQDVISDMIKMASAAGCKKAARVGGGSVLGPLQLRRLSTTSATYPHDYFETWEEAEAYLDEE